MKMVSIQNNIRITYDSDDNGECVIFGKNGPLIIDKYEMPDLIKCAKSFEEHMRKAGQIRGDLC